MRALRERRAGPLAITDVVGRYRSGNGERPGSHPSQEARNGGPWCMNPSEAGGGGGCWKRGHRDPSKREEGSGWVRQEMTETWKGLKRAGSGQVCFFIYPVRQKEALKDFQQER